MTKAEHFTPLSVSHLFILFIVNLLFQLSKLFNYLPLICIPGKRPRLVILHLCANGAEFASKRRTGRGGQEPPKGLKWEWG